MAATTPGRNSSRGRNSEPSIGGRPLSILLCVIAAIAIGLLGVLSPAITASAGFRTMLAERGMAWWLVSVCGFAAGLAGLAASVGLCFAADWGRRMLIGLVAVLPFFLLTTLPIGWFIVALAVTTTVLVLLNCKSAVAYLGAVDPSPEFGPKSVKIDGRVLASAYALLVITAGTLRIIYSPPAFELPPIAFQGDRTEASPTSNRPSAGQDFASTQISPSVASPVPGPSRLGVRTEPNLPSPTVQVPQSEPASPRSRVATSRPTSTVAPLAGPQLARTDAAGIPGGLGGRTPSGMLPSSSGAIIIPSGKFYLPTSRYNSPRQPVMTAPRYPRFDSATSFRDLVPPGAWLVGFEATLSGADAAAVVTSVRPIFRKDGVETRGESHGIAGPHRVESKAPQGFAVGALAAPGGVTRDGFYMVMMNIVDDRLEPRVQFEAPPIGGLKTTDADWIGQGAPVRAVFGRTGDRGEFIGMGLEFAPMETADPDPWRNGPEIVPDDPKKDGTRGTGGFGSGRSAGYCEGPITAVEFGLVEWFGRDVIGAVHALDSKNTSGKPNPDWNWDRKVRIEARPGYALSGMRVSGETNDFGRTNVDGVQLLFSRLSDGMLDRADSYESEPVGDVRENRRLLLSSRGRIVNGLYSMQQHGRVTGLMLRFKSLAGGASPHPDDDYRPRKQPADEIEAAHGAVAETAIEGTTITRLAGFNAGNPRWKSTRTWSTGILSGFEVGLAKREGKEFVCGLRPILPDAFGGVRERSTWYGSPGVRQVRTEAEPGYAVSAVRVFGKETVEGLQLTFSRIRDDQLVLDDGYNAEPIGTSDQRPYVQLTGRGRRIAGLSVVSPPGGITALGLAFAEPKGPPKE